MGHSILFLIYIVAAFVAALVISRKADRNWFSLILVFWIFAQPVMQAFFVYKIPGLNFDLHANRVFFLFLLAYILSGSALGRPYAYAPATAIRRPFFEKYFYIYLIIVTIAIALNFSALSPRSIIATPLEIVAFITVYTATKRYATALVLESILKAVVFLAAFSAFVAITQFAVDPLFMRTGEAKAAFGETLRAFGIFQFDGELGAFQIFSLVVVLTRYRGMLRFALALLLVLSIFLTFHRLSYVTLFACLLIYIMFFSKRKAGAVLVLLIPMVLVLSYNVYKSTYGGGAGIEQRITSDTVSGRIDQYRVTLEAIQNTPLGVGGYENPIYVKLMKDHDMVKWVPDGPNHSHPEALEVHNGYLDVGIKYGILGGGIFVALMVSMARYFRRMVSGRHPYSIVPVFAVLIWMMSNTTQTNSNFRAHYVILLAMICGAFVARCRSENVKNDKNPAHVGMSANLA